MATAFTRMHVEVDWDGNGQFRNPHSVIPLDRIRAIRVRRGLDTSSGTVKEGVPMSMNISLTNEDELYTDANSNSPLFGRVRAGVDVRVYLEAARRPNRIFFSDGSRTFADGRQYYSDSITPLGRVQIGEGRIDNFRQISKANEAPVILFEVQGALRRLSAGRIDITPRRNITAFEAINSILDDASWPTGVQFRNIDEVNTIVAIRGGEMTPLDALREITNGVLNRETGVREGGIGGNILDTRLGGVWFQGPDYRKGRPSHMEVLDDIVIGRESQAVTLAPISRYRATLLRYAPTAGLEGRSLSSRAYADWLGYEFVRSAGRNPIHPNVGRTSFYLPAARQVFKRGPRDWIATDWEAPTPTIRLNRQLDSTGEPGAGKFDVFIESTNGRVASVNSSAASVFSAEINPATASQFTSPEYTSVGVTVRASRAPRSSDVLPGSWGGGSNRIVSNWLIRMGPVRCVRNNFTEVEDYVFVDPALSRYGIRDYPLVPDIFAVATDMTPLRATASTWHRALQNISGASTPTVLTLDLAAHLSESTRSLLMTIDSGDPIYLQLIETDARVVGQFHVDSVEWRLDSNGIMFVTLQLTQV